MTRFLLVLVAIALISVPCRALQWDIESVHDAGLALGDCTLLFTGAAAPKVVYSAAGSVRLATRTETPWPYETVASSGFFNAYSSAAYDRTGSIGVAFIDGSTLKYATNVSGSWAMETIVSPLGFDTDFTAIAYDSTNTPWIAFSDGDFFNPTISIAQRQGLNNWQVTPLSSIGDSTGPAIAVAPNDTIYVSFVDSTSKSLKVARRPSGGTWTVDTVDGSLSSPAIGYTSITIDPAGRPAVSYFGDSVGDSMWLKYAVKTDIGWQTEPVVQVPAGIDGDCSIAVAPDSAPWIAYVDTTDYSLACARKLGGSWMHETVDSEDVICWRPSIRLDYGGNPSIAYINRSQGTVNFATAIIPRTIADVKKLPDGITVRCEGLITTTGATETGSDFSDRHYVQTLDRSSGIMLYYGDPPDLIERGTYVTVTGVTGRVGGERAITAPVILPGLTDTEPAPLGMTNAAVGGGPLGYSPGPPSTGQKGIVGASGLNNIGALVRVWGWVGETDTAMPARWFKIEDGSGVRLKCMLPVGVAAPSGYVRLNGISSCEEDGSSNLTRLLRLRSAQDIGT